MGTISVPGVFELDPNAAREVILGCGGHVVATLGFGKGPVVKGSDVVMHVESEAILEQQKLLFAHTGPGGRWQADRAAERLVEMGLAESLVAWIRGKNGPIRRVPMRAPLREAYVLDILRNGERFAPGKALFRYGPPDRLIVSCQVPKEVMQYLDPGNPAIVSLPDWGGRAVQAEVADVGLASRSGAMQTVFLRLGPDAPRDMPAQTRLSIRINAPRLERDYRAQLLPTAFDAKPSPRDTGLLTRGRAGGHETLNMKEMRAKAERDTRALDLPEIEDIVPVAARADLAPYTPDFSSRLRKTKPIRELNRHQWKMLKLRTAPVGCFVKLDRQLCTAELSWGPAVPASAQGHAIGPWPILNLFPGASPAASAGAASGEAPATLRSLLTAETFAKVYGQGAIHIALRLRRDGDTGVFAVPVSLCTVMRTGDTVNLTIPLPLAAAVTGEAGPRSVLLWNQDRAAEWFVVPGTAVVRHREEAVVFVHVGNGRLAQVVVDGVFERDGDQVHLRGPDLRGERVVANPLEIGKVIETPSSTRSPRALEVDAAGRGSSAAKRM